MTIQNRPTQRDAHENWDAVCRKTAMERYLDGEGPLPETAGRKTFAVDASGQVVPKPPPATTEIAILAPPTVPSITTIADYDQLVGFGGGGSMRGAVEAWLDANSPPPREVLGGDGQDPVNGPSASVDDEKPDEEHASEGGFLGSALGLGEQCGELTGETEDEKHGDNPSGASERVQDIRDGLHVGERTGGEGGEARDSG